MHKHVQVIKHIIRSEALHCATEDAPETGTKLTVITQGSPSSPAVTQIFGRRRPRYVTKEAAIDESLRLTRRGNHPHVGIEAGVREQPEVLHDHAVGEEHLTELTSAHALEDIFLTLSHFERIHVLRKARTERRRRTERLTLQREAQARSKTKSHEPLMRNVIKSRKEKSER